MKASPDLAFPADEKQRGDERCHDTPIKVHMISETAWVTQGQGVDTAFREMIQLFDASPCIKLVINNEGIGDIFHSHTYGPYYFYKGWRYKGKRILTAHVIPESSKGSLPFWKLIYPFTRWYLKMVYNYADHIIAISPGVEQSIKNLKVKTKLHAIYNPVLKKNWETSTSKRLLGRKMLNIKEDEKVVIGVGQLQARKGVEDFIDIAAALPEYKFIWVGGRPWGRFTEGVSRIDERIKNATPNLFFTGLLELSKMPLVYAAAELLLFTSYQENCPLAPLEAAAAGLPVIFRDLPEYRKLYKHPYLHASTNEDYILISQHLLENDAARNVAIGSSKALLYQFNEENIRKKLIKLYEEVYNKI